MFSDSRFWIGVVVGAALLWGYQRYMGKKGQA